MPIFNAVQEGYDARKKYGERATNPYAHGTAPYWGWLTGYYRATHEIICDDGSDGGEVWCYCPTWARK